MAYDGLKMGTFHLLGHPKCCRIILRKRIFNPFLTHCWSPNRPFAKHFGFSRAPKCFTTGSKRAKYTCFGIPHGLGLF